MKILVIGSGGREHALAWKISQSPRVDQVFVAPGNAGTARDVENIAIAETDFEQLIEFVKKNDVSITVVGPEAPLSAGIVDVFEKEGLKIFGPNQEAAQMESSKVYCKDLLRKADIPTADYQVFHDAESASHFVQNRYADDAGDVPLVIKADGLAAGKGVVVCHNKIEAIEAIDQIARQKVFGEAGSQILIEERLDGEEASVLAITDGKTIVTLPAAQDHKPAFDGDKGPNTGGMGAYCPTPSVSDEQMNWIEEHVLVPTVHSMKIEGCRFKGLLYAGLMMTRQGPKVLEYNVRFGDPECQPLLTRLKSDIVDLIEATIDGTLDQIEPLQWDTRPSICVVMASEGYPGSYKKGLEISGLDEVEKMEDVKVFHAGTKLVNGKVLTNGGRVLGVTATGNSVSAAKLLAYTAVQKIRWPGVWCRKDIADKAIYQKS
ncbi:MAG: phosphoribosylamine--glycine ligase [Pirellulaceae bacterium]|nr:phosphoribosylamine--glycine ligase [Pirellulaceae bacterium]